MTIIEAIKQVMQAKGAPMSAREAYEAILRAGLYEFRAQDPAHVVVAQIRRHTKGIDFKSAGRSKHFVIAGDNKFWPIDQPLQKIESEARRSGAGLSEEDSLETTLTDLKALRERYISLLKDRLVSEISRLTPEGFEHFSRALLQVYGFTDTCVTRVGTDGGLDGHGKLKVGLADLNVSFQCKRWTKGNVQRVEIDRFRGASQGEFEQGIFFTTSGFSRGAIGASIRRGAIPIVLIDGSAIVNLMIERRFGVDMQDISVPLYALDLAFE